MLSLSYDQHCTRMNKLHLNHTFFLLVVLLLAAQTVQSFHAPSLHRHSAYHHHHDATKLNALPLKEMTASSFSSLPIALDSYESGGVPPTLLAFALMSVIVTLAIPQLSRFLVIKSNSRSLSDDDKLNPPPNPYN